MKAIILARVSSREQEDNNSIPAQTRRLTEYADRFNLDVIEVCQLVESSTKTNRKRYSEIIARIKSSSSEVALITDTIDRLQRDFKESVMLDEIRKSGKLQLHFVREGLVIHRDSNSSEILRWDMGVMFAKSYVTQLSDNVRRSNEQKRSNGEWCGKAPFGYRNIDLPDGKKWIEPNDNAQIVKQIFEWYASRSHSMLEIKEMVMEHYGIKLARSSIDRILKRPFYHGIMLVKGNPYAHSYTTLITRNLYESANRVSAKRKEEPLKYAGLPYPYRGLIRCATCGCSITPERSKGHIYYHCTQSKGKHGARYVREEDLTNQMSEIFERIKPNRAQFDQVIDALKKSHADKIKYKKDRTARITSELTKLENRLSRLHDLYLDGDISKDDYQSKKQTFKSDGLNLRAKLGSLNSSNNEFYDSSVKIMELAKNAPQLFRSSEMQEKRQLINLVLQNLELHDDRLVWEYKKPFNLMASYTDNSSWLGIRDDYRTLIEADNLNIVEKEIDQSDEEASDV